jgi:hypothetical protein
MTRTIEIGAFAVAVLVAALAIHAWLASRDDQRRVQAALTTQKQLIDAASLREAARDTTLQQTLAQIDALKRSTQTPSEILRDLPKYLDLPAPIALSPNISSTSSAAGARTSVPESARSAGTKQQGTGASRGSNPLDDSDSNRTLSSDFSAPPNPLPDAPSQNLPKSFSSGGDLKGTFSGDPSAASAEIPAADLKPLYDYVQDCRACQARLAAATQNAADDASKIAALTRDRDAALVAAKGGSFWQRFRRNALWLAVGAGLGYAAHR